MLSIFPNNKKQYHNNINYSSNYKKLYFEQNIDYNSKINQKKLSLNSINNKHINDSIINKKLNNSSLNINNNISLNKIPKIFHKKTKSETNSLNKINHNKNISKKKDKALNKNIKFYRNNNQNIKLNNSLKNASRTNFDFFKKQYNNKKDNIENNYSNKLNISSLDNLSKINKKNKSKNDINHNIINYKDKSQNQNLEKIKKSKISNKFKTRAKTPIISSKASNNNSKSKNKNLNIRNNSSKEKKIINDNKYKNNLLYYGANLNISDIIRKKNYAMKNNIRKKIFESNNIFAKFKPKKKSKTIILQEELQMKQNFLLSKFFNSNSNKENINKENNIYIIENVNKNNNKNENTNCFIEIHPKIIQQESEKNLNIKNDDDSNKEILQLTNNSTKMNILINNNSSNGHSKTNSNNSNNSNIVSSFTLRQQFNSNNNIFLNNNNYQNNNLIGNNNDSNIQLQNLNIYSTQSLNNNTNRNTNSNTNNNTFYNDTFNNNKNLSSIINSPQLLPTFKGKKIRCIHDISKTGLAGDEKKVNQDRYFIFRNFVEGFDNIFMGVCDGHGFFGNEVSEYIKENLPMDLNRIIKTKKLDLNKDDLSEVIISTFIMENNSLLRNKQIDSDLSGSTCVSVIYTPQKLIISNLGDSRCVLGKCKNGEWEFENLSKDHKPNVKEEAERIKKSGGRIRPMIDEDGCFVGPLRVYMRDKDLPGLAMTRSFGDYFASLAGTISIPEIKEHFLVPEDKFIILASDGLFEFISSKEVGNIIKGYYEKNDVVGCCEYLYKESYRKWIVEEEDTVDDITIILVFFED